MPSTRSTDSADGIGVILATLLLCLPQAPAPSAPAQPERTKLGVEFDKNGWPVAPASQTRSRDSVTQPLPSSQGPRDQMKAAHAPDAAPSALPAAPALEAAPTVSTVAGSRNESSLASLLAAFRSLGFVRLKWSVSIVGADGKSIADRRVTHLFATEGVRRDRLEFEDGRTFVRLGEVVQASRHGMPWPTLEQGASRELAAFGEHAQLPWFLVDGERFEDLGTGKASKAGEQVRRFRARFDGAQTGQPRHAPEVVELVQIGHGEHPQELILRADDPLHRRRVLLEDWRSVHGIQAPHRRTYCGPNGEPQCVMVLTQAEVAVGASDSDFRLR